MSAARKSKKATKSKTADIFVGLIEEQEARVRDETLRLLREGANPADTPLARLAAEHEQVAERERSEYREQPVVESAPVETQKAKREPIAKQVKSVYRMGEGDDAVLSPVDELVQQIQQWAAMATSDDLKVKQSARQHLREIAEAAVASRVRPVGAARGGATSGATKAKKAADKKDALTKKFRALIATGDRDASEAIDEMVEKKLAGRSTLRRHLADELAKLGRTRETSKALSAKKIRKPAK